MWKEIVNHISNVTGKPFTLEQSKNVNGGCINQSYKIQGQGQSYFVKLNQASTLDMFKAEAFSLQKIMETNTICVPEVITFGISQNQSYLVLSWLELGRGNNQSWRTMGRNLANLHRYSVSDRFGWESNNTIGSTPQINDWSNDWADFFAERRIGYQLEMAQRKGGNLPPTEMIVEKVRNYLKPHRPTPALVHGDLWSGNVSILENGESVIFDPASYYGDPEVDLAMTELFGGFPNDFYQGYQEILPPSKEYQKRKILYNLYHILNHFNLFGGGYASQANRMIQSLFP